MPRIVSFGEMLLRLNSPDHNRLLQTPSFSASFGGAELNVLASLSRLGIAGTYITALPDHALGTVAIEEIQRHGLESTYIKRKPGRLGLYFLETGISLRPSKVIYDRAGSVFSNITAHDFDWPRILDGADWLHLTGITPALGLGPAHAVIAAAKAACDLNIPISFDLNYRQHLWQANGLSPQEVLSPVLELITILSAGADDCEACFGLPVSGLTDPIARFDQHADHFLSRYPKIKTIVSTFRDAQNASNNTIWARAVNRDQSYTSSRIEISGIIDRIGAGDAFMAGLIYGQLMNWNIEKTLNFAIAADVLKHSIHGDINLATQTEIENLMNGSVGGRVDR